MTTIHAKVQDQVLTATILPKVACNNKKSVKLCIEWAASDTTWDEYPVLNALFYTDKDPTVYPVMVDAYSECIIPHEVLAEAGYLFITLQGINSSTGKVKSTTPIKYKILPGTPSLVVSDPSPSVYEQLATKNKVLEARMDTIETGSTVEGSEVMGIRTGYDGTKYDSAGTAVQSQVAEMNAKAMKNAVSIAKNRAFDYDNLDIFESVGYLQADGSLYTTETGYHCKYTQKIPCVEGDVFRYEGVGEFNAVSYIFYYGNNIVSTGQMWALNTMSPKTVTVPANVNGVVFSSYARTGSEVVLNVTHYLSSIYQQLSGLTKQAISNSNMVVDALLGLISAKDTEEMTPTWTDNYYCGYDGKIVEYESIRMGKISVSPGEIITINGAVWSSVALYAFCDRANRLVNGYPSANLPGEAENATATVVVPEDAAYLYINDITQKKTTVNAPSVTKIKTYQRNAHNILDGKVYVAVGDSYTEGDFSGWSDENGLSGTNSPVIYDSVRGMYKTYPWWIAERNNMKLHNCGKCGSIVALDKDYVEGVSGVKISSREPFSYMRYKELPDVIDYMTFWFGINDASHTNLGNINDNDNTTFYGAWNVVLPYLIEKYPLCKMGFIVTTGATSAYRKAIRDIAIKWGIPYLDLTGDSSVPMMNGRESTVEVCNEAVRLRKAAFMLSNGHFNVQGHEYESTFIENFLRSL